MYIIMLFVAMLISLLQYDQVYSKSCTVDPTADIVQNAALNKTASQISDYSLLGVASKAVDGDNNPKFFDGSCTHTRYLDPRLYRWWMVDLEREYRIDSLNITNRVGKSGSKLRDFDIYVSLNITFKDNDHMAEASLCFHVSGGMGSGETRTFSCQTPVFGQFVQIYMETPELRNLHMCEVTVQGYPAVCVEDTKPQPVSNKTHTPVSTVPEVTKPQPVSNKTPATAFTVPEVTKPQPVPNKTPTTAFTVPEVTKPQPVSSKTPTTAFTVPEVTKPQPVPNKTPTTAFTVLEVTKPQPVSNKTPTTAFTVPEVTKAQPVSKKTPTPASTVPESTTTLPVSYKTPTTASTEPEDTTTPPVLNKTPTIAFTVSEDTTKQPVSNMTHSTFLTVPDDSSTTAPPMCPCWCNVSSSTNQNLTQDELVELVKELAKELTVNKKETSMSKRKHISVGDERQSAETIGIVGVLALCVPVLLIVSFDLINLWSFLRQAHGRKIRR